MSKSGCLIFRIPLCSTYKLHLALKIDSWLIAARFKKHDNEANEGAQAEFLSSNRHLNPFEAVSWIKGKDA
jgi:hypothetical protein